MPYKDHLDFPCVIFQIFYSSECYIQLLTECVNFCEGCMSVSRFDFLYVDIQFLWHRLLKRLIFALLYCFRSFVKDQLTIYFQALYSILLIYSPTLSATLTALIIALWYVFKSDHVGPLILLFSHNVIMLAILGLLTLIQTLE